MPPLELLDELELEELLDDELELLLDDEEFELLLEELELDELLLDEEELLDELLEPPPPKATSTQPWKRS